MGTVLKGCSWWLFLDPRDDDAISHLGCVGVNYG